MFIFHYCIFYFVTWYCSCSMIFHKKNKIYVCLFSFFFFSFSSFSFYIYGPSSVFPLYTSFSHCFFVPLSFLFLLVHSLLWSTELSLTWFIVLTDMDVLICSNCLLDIALIFFWKRLELRRPLLYSSESIPVEACNIDLG